jgi:hypothetical protein
MFIYLFARSALKKFQIPPMGLFASSQHCMEAQIVRLRDALASHYTADRRRRIWRGVSNFAYWLSILSIAITWLCSHYLEIGLGMHFPFPRTLLIIFLAVNAAWALLSFYLGWSTENIREKIEVTRDELSHTISAYEELCQLPEIREILKKNGFGEDFIHPISISMSDFGAETTAKTRNSVLWRIWDWVVGDGPDYRYALICPSCHRHNGMVDESCLPMMKYRCEGCKCFVSATEVLPEEQRTSPTRAVVDWTEREKALDQIDDEEDVSD